MKIAFIQPNVQDGNLIPSLGILYLAAISELNEHEIKVYDERFNNTISEVVEFKPDIVGITAVTGAILRGKFIAGEIKKKIKTAIVFEGRIGIKSLELTKWTSITFH